MKRRLTGALLALPLVAALALAGCVGTDDDGIASANEDAADAESGDGEGTGPGELTEEELYDAQLEYVACLRENGLDIEDPQPGEPMRIQIQGNPEEAEAAMTACEELMPQRGPGGGPPEDAQEDMLEFAQCMRDHGVESFEDPEPGGGIQVGPDQAEDPDFEAAQEACNEGSFGGQPDTNGNGGGRA